VGSLRAQPQRGLTHQQLNLVSARNVIGMAISDGVPYFVLLSAVSNPPGISAEYLRSKREAEEYLRNSGLRWAIVRAPVLFDRAQRGGLFFSVISRFGSLPLLRVFWGRRAPLPVDIAARGIARAALQEALPQRRVLYARDLRRLGRVKKEKRPRDKPTGSSRSLPAYLMDEETPFGWLPGSPPEDKD
jgi:uncharacterized protein YbjT (DUF2867 family)